MKVTNPHDHDVDVPALGVTVAARATVDVPVVAGRALAAQGWPTPATKTAAKKAPAKRAAAKTPEAAASDLSEED